MDTRGLIVYDSCMGKTITIDDNAYHLLSSLKLGGRDSFTKVILRHVRKPADTGGELLEALETEPAPAIALPAIDAFLAQRKRRSPRAK